MRILCLACALVFFLVGCANSSKAAEPALPSSISARPDASTTDGPSSSTKSTLDEPKSVEQPLHDAYFSSEHRWPRTAVSGDPIDQPLLSATTADLEEVRYTYTVTDEGTIERISLKKDPDMGNWRSQLQEGIAGSLNPVTECTTPDMLPVSSTGRPLFVEEGKRIVETNVNCEDKKLLYEGSGTLSHLQASTDLLFFIENGNTLCRLHRASGIIDKWPLPHAVTQFSVVSSETVMWTGVSSEGSYILSCKTGESRKLEQKDYDELGRLIYSFS